MDTRHIYDRTDPREHIRDGLRCWCKPESKVVGGFRLITHHRSDEVKEGSEITEQGNGDSSPTS